MGRQRRRGGGAGVWQGRFQQLRLGTMVQLRRAQACPVSLHLLVNVVLALCQGAQGRDQVKRGWETSSWKHGRLGSWDSRELGHRASSSREEPIQRSQRQHLRVVGTAQGPRLTRGCGGGGLVILRLARLSEHTVNLQHIHPLAQLMLELCQSLLRGDLLPCKPLHLMFILFLLPLQGLGTGQGTAGCP